jgi:dTDP-L-rhamnose 4-epimerase
LLAAALGSTLQPELTRKYRAGDIRHCFADLTRARASLGYEPEVNMEDGLLELTAWLATQTAQDLVPTASRELELRGLTA